MTRSPDRDNFLRQSRGAFTSALFGTLPKTPRHPSLSPPPGDAISALPPAARRAPRDPSPGSRRRCPLVGTEGLGGGAVPPAERSGCGAGAERVRSRRRLPAARPPPRIPPPQSGRAGPLLRPPINPHRRGGCAALAAAGLRARGGTAHPACPPKISPLPSGRDPRARGERSGCRRSAGECPGCRGGRLWGARGCWGGRLWGVHGAPQGNSPLPTAYLLPSFPPWA